ncbi:unnamed protein product [Hyaloperonospora brassicae]|uniref:Uncharacterized protein n=1 Tax=Hyaloperonospora brassicae TaxID=162125 RepID=A0AAV0SXX1_HYABA|nr:unnamed protein product [Hyaloperonospora brassicae]
MGCCLSREDDHLDGGREALLPKGRSSNKRVDKSVDVDTVKKEGSANGSHKSPSAVVAAADANAKVAAKPQPPKKPAGSSDLRGHQGETPTSMGAGAPVVKPHKSGAKTTPLPREAAVSSKTSSETPVETEDDDVMASAFTSVAVKTEDVNKVKQNGVAQDHATDGADSKGGNRDKVHDTPKEPKSKKVTTSSKKSKKKRKKGKK